MEITDDLRIGQVVKSKAGRDKGRIFVVIEIVDDQYVRLCDGELRKVSKPKLKKIKHLIVYNRVFEEIETHLNKNEKLNNAYIRRLLEPYNVQI
ncbi:MAG: KOW domain-containing RNA-binding protein [Tissierellales bacterium]|nr:KOW domain-containing RNA-binding protein [Tissierellales bacterium]MBN2827127.1 KOW domain-containing RNA-binding protein [Tissierellales bacterium]